MVRDRGCELPESVQVEDNSRRDNRGREGDYMEAAEAVRGKKRREEEKSTRHGLLIDVRALSLPRRER